MRSLELFVAAYEYGSFTKAAEHANATQSGVSQHIAKLEQIHGVALFRREGGRISPTPAADVFYRDCTALLRAQEAAVSSLKSFSKGLNGEVSVGLMPTLNARALAPSLLTFKAAHPNASIKIVEGYSGALTGMIVSREIDFAVVPSAPAATGLIVRRFISTEEVFVSRANAEPAATSVDLTTLEPLRLVLPSAGNTRAETIRTYLNTHDIAVEAILEVDSMMATLDLVARSEWSAILPALMMGGRHSEGRLRVRRITPPLSLDLVTLEAAKRSLSPVARAFRDIILFECSAILSGESAAVD
jgi:LysR family nitrogen assimilation transcriptional regulator